MRAYERFQNWIEHHPLKLKVQQFIRDEGIEKLKEKYDIDVKEYSRHYLLNYNMINSVKTNPIVQECRALVLDKFDLSVAARSFFRFFNYGEISASNSFDLVNVVSTQKIDGSLIYVWWNKYEESWQVSTRKMLYAEGDIQTGTETFDSIVRRTFCCPLDELFDEGERDRTFVFEFVSPQTRVTTRYDKAELFLLTIVENNEDYEYCDKFSLEERAKELCVSIPKIRLFRNKQEIEHVIANELTEWDEGFVLNNKLKHGKIWRMKFKNPRHFALSKMRNNGGPLTEKGMCTLVMTFEEDEYLTYFPDDYEFFKPYILARESLLLEINNSWEENKCIEIQKEFAEVIKDIPYKGILFSMRKGLTLEEALERTTDSSKRQLLLKFKT